MARNLIIGWDVGSISAETFIGGTDGAPTIVGSVSQETSIFRSGTGSLKLTPASGANGYWSPSTGTAYATSRRCRFYCRITSLPATARLLLSSNSLGLDIRLNTNGTLSLLDVGSVLGTSTVALTDTNRWYNIEIGNPTAGSGILRIDGNQEVSGGSSKGAGTRFGAQDTVAATYTAYIDDFVTDTADWPGESRVTMLIPTGDTQIGSWTGGTGGTSNLFDAVDNRPPIGTASESNTTQIESADGSGDNATDEYRATMQSYTTGGISASATIKCIAALIAHGEDVSTGTKTGSVAIIANPNVGTYHAFTFGSDGGALGTFPSGWTLADSAVTDSPSVTMSTSPQIAVRKTDTGTRVASVCFIGLKVEYIDRSLAFNPNRRRNRIIR